MPKAAKKSRGAAPSVEGANTNPSFDLRHHPFTVPKPTCIFNGDTYFHPLGSTNLNNDVDITFEIEVPQHMFMHPAENPFIMRYVIEDGNGAPVVPSTLANREENEILAMSSALGGGSFFDSVEIKLNDQPLLGQTGYIGNYDFLYTTINRLFSTEEDKIGCMGKDSLLLQTDDWVTANPTTKKSDRQEAEIANCDFVNNAEATRVTQISAFGFDSVPFCGAKNFCMEKIRNRSIPNAILRPGSKLSIRLFKSQPFYKKLLWKFNAKNFCLSSLPNVAGPTGWEHGNAATPVDKLKLKITSLEFRMKSMISVKQEEIKRTLSTRNMYYDIDLVDFHSSSIIYNHALTETKVHLKPNTKLLYIGFVRDHVLYPPVNGLKTPVVPWFTFPSGLSKLLISIDGGPPLIKKDGLSDLYGLPGSQSQSAMSYHDYLTERNFTDYPFSVMFPRKDHPITQVIVLDLSDQPLSERPTLTVECEWKNSSPMKYNLITFGVRPSTICIEPGKFTTINDRS